VDVSGIILPDIVFESLISCYCRCFDMEQPSYPYPASYGTAQSSRRAKSPAGHTAAYPLNGLNQQEYAESWASSPLFPVTNGYINLASTTSTTNGIPVTTIPLPPTTGPFSHTFATFGMIILFMLLDIILITHRK
jgi:hypothetical protein